MGSVRRSVSERRKSPPKVDVLHSWTLASIFGVNRLYKSKDTKQYTLEASRHVRKGEATVPVDVLCSKPPLHSFLIINPPDRNVISSFSLTALNTVKSHATFILYLNNENCVAVAFQLRGYFKLTKIWPEFFSLNTREKRLNSVLYKQNALLSAPKFVNELRL